MKLKYISKFHLCTCLLSMRFPEPVSFFQAHSALHNKARHHFTIRLQFVSMGKTTKSRHDTAVSLTSNVYYPLRIDLVCPSVRASASPYVSCNSSEREFLRIIHQH